jgi:hypothetical protein
MQRLTEDWTQLDEVERTYREAPLGPAPSGVYRGRFLHWLPPSRQWHVRVVDTLLFRWPRFGVDFDRRLWWFVRPALAAGRFQFSPGPSRWRAAETYRLEYDVSRLPVRGILYDEVKPISADLCLGLGGVNAPTGHGDHFWFALVRA